jgi:hypothetical protein
MNVLAKAAGGLASASWPPVGSTVLAQRMLKVAC